ncbi:uncharacterized protein Z518_00160 [Rhinocladiella mackenziei CBS 650.93]|uniref:Membrane insertase YidC/Oxa/ALB C-terminal domain-containing protein n=1 Tax=Rhinocladiella mackenziei CBS 650.93 TaxID=1442369 RepID=A0A0D2G3F1_9EURO|nr:uncharacterized protein Z518_00160 [Rhinocladiella mackenziei CBS 650.93]KIX09082.1 hypothetical protein Z518_00160 [Rhinocladiella mackenziei CBS 650.93]
MSISQGLRASSRGLNNCRQVLVLGRRDVRHFSHNATRSSMFQSKTTRRATPTTIKQSQQIRSLSLFGWGSKNAPDEFANAHSSSLTPPIGSTTTEASPSSQNVINSTRTVKASHATSEAPDPSSSSPTEALQDLEDLILKPHGATLPSDPTGGTPDLASIPEGIGYLKNVCGLDFGWGTSTMMEFCLEHLHTTAGLSWSVSIIALLFLIRGFIFPFSVSASDQSAKLRELQPVLAPLNQKVQAALRDGNRQLAMITQTQVNQIRKESGVSLRKAFMPLLLQLPLQIGAYRVLWGASHLPVPAFETESLLWLTNLSAGDPLWLLPVLTGAITYVNIATMQKGQAQNPSMTNIQNFMKVLFPAGSFVFLCFQPAAIQMYFFVSGIFTQIQTSIIQNPSFRKWQGLTPLTNLPTPGPGAGPTSPGTTRSSRFAKMNVAKPIEPIPETPRPEPSSGPSPDAANRSIIDKGVDQIKELGQNTWKSTIGSMGETWQRTKQEKMEKAKADKLKAEIARYEAHRRQDLELERENRNAAAVGPMRVKGSWTAPLASKQKKTD